MRSYATIYEHYNNPPKFPKRVPKTVAFEVALMFFVLLLLLLLVHREID